MDIERQAIGNVIDWWSRVAVASGGAVTAANDVVVVDAGGANGMLNRAVVVRRGADAATVAASVRAAFGARPGGPVSVFDPFSELDLAPHGFELSVMLPHLVHARLDPEPPATSATVHEVEVAGDLAAFEGLVRSAFSFLPWDPVPFLPAAVLGGTSHLFLARIDGEPVACALAHDQGGVTGVYLVGTHPDHGRRGLGEAVTWAASAAVPGQPATLQASMMGRGLYERMGYEPFGTIAVWFSERP